MPRPAAAVDRAEVLAAARDAFNARGFAATRMEDIAREVGLSKAALYLRFPSKEAVFEEVVRDLIAQSLPEAFPSDFAQVPAGQILRRFIDYAFAKLTSPEMAFVPRVIIGEGANFPELARFYHSEVVSRILDQLELVIRHGVARGEFVCARPDHACRSIAGGVIFAALWRNVFEPVGAEAIDVADLAAAHAEIVLAGLLVRQGDKQ